MSQPNRYVSLSLLSICLLVASCTKSPLLPYAREAVPTPSEKEILQMPADSTNGVYEGLLYPKIVYRFYRSRLFEIAWQKDRSNAMADSLFSFLRSARFYGLLALDYHRDELASSPPTQVDSIYRNEALLTDAFLSLANDLKLGRLNLPVDFDRDSLILGVLENAFERQQVKSILEAQEPVYKQYKDLKGSLGRILRTADSVDFNLLCSGVTIDSLDLHKEVQLIEINMERWRQEKFDVEQRCIRINIPSFQLHVVESGQTVIKSRVIVGKPESPTPVLSSLIECMTLYPYWHIPRKIAIEEYLPEIQKDSSFLTRNNFDVLDRKGNLLNSDTLDWLTYSAKHFPISLRQREGPENSLGVIKFVFDNPYAVFLHDTNVKSLFKKKVRAYSHGCIRMEKALELAKFLAPDPDKVEAKLRLKERFTINLKRPIPIYVRYFTCEYSEGALIFYNDIYEQDGLIAQILYRERNIRDL